MLRNESFARRLAGAVAVIAIVAMAVAAASPAHAHATATSEASNESARSIAWPAFSDALDEQDPPQIFPPPDWTPHSLFTSRAVVSAPLPQAVVSGLFMLGGNWVVTRMWKKRKI